VPTSTAQVGQVVGAGEAAVDHGDDPSEPPAPHVVFDLGQDRLVVGVAGQHHTRTGMPSVVTASPMSDLRQVVAVILAVAVAAERVLADLLAVAFEVRAGGVEEQQVDLS